MSDETALIPASILDQTQLVAFDDRTLEAATKSSAFLARLQLCTSRSKQCERNEIAPNHYGFIEDQHLRDLGETVDIVVCSIRPKAMQFGDEGDVISVFDPKLDENNMATGEFRRIQEESEKPNSGCMYGVEFLVWIPAIERFAGLYMGSASHRREAPQLKQRLRRAATLKWKRIDTKKYSWSAITVFDCSTPCDPPPTEKLLMELEKFNHPPEAVVETIDDAAEAERPR